MYHHSLSVRPLARFIGERVRTFLHIRRRRRGGRLSPSWFYAILRRCCDKSVALSNTDDVPDTRFKASALLKLQFILGYIDAPELKLTSLFRRNASLDSDLQVDQRWWRVSMFITQSRNFKCEFILMRWDLVYVSLYTVSLRIYDPKSKCEKVDCKVCKNVTDFSSFQLNPIDSHTSIGSWFQTPCI